MIACANQSGRSLWRWILGWPVALAALAVPVPTLAQELPRVFLDTTYSPPGPIVSVPAGANLQTYIDNAQLGTTLELPAGATFNPITLPNKTGSGWIYIRSSAYTSLPSPGKRVFPSHASLMPKIRTTDGATPAVRAATGAHHYRFVGIEILTTIGGYDLNLVQIGTDAHTQLSEFPSDIVFDRSYIHGTAGGDMRRCVATNSARTSVIDSYLSRCHHRSEDAQAIGGWAGPGPFKVVNNYLEGSGENVIYGGGTPAMSGLVPSDIEIRRNHFFKPLTWKSGHPTYQGIQWQVKNLFELKNARRVLVEGNIMENNWDEGQDGTAVLFTPRGQSTCTWCTVEDVTFQKNIVRNAAAGFNITGTDSPNVSQQAARILIKDNLLYDLDNTVWAGGCCTKMFLVTNQTELNTARAGGVKNLIIDHNTTRMAGSATSLMAFGPSDAPDDKHVSPIIRNNLFQRGTYGIFTDGVEGTTPLNTYTSNYTFQRNVIIGATASRYPSQTCPDSGTTCYPTSSDNVGFVDWRNDDYRLCETGMAGCASPSPYNNAGTDNKDIGADIAAVTTATAGAISGSWGGTNAPPTITTPLSATPNPAPIGQAVTLSVTASDPNGDPLTYTFDFDDGTAPVQGSSNSVQHTYASLGTFTATVTVSDGTASVQDTEDVNVVCTSCDTGSPVAYWKFDEGSGTAAADSSGNGHNGTLTGGASWRTDGATSTAVTFGGDGQHVRIPNPSALLQPTNTYAISAWVSYTTTDSNGGDVASMGDSYLLRVRPSGDVGTFIYNGTTWVGAETTGLNTKGGLWHHIIGQYTGSAMQVYVNGILRRETTVSAPIVYGLAPDFIIGQNGQGGSVHSFVGGIDEVRVYNQALTVSEIEALTLASPASAYSHWKFDETSGTTASDSTIHRNHATVTGATWDTTGRVGGALTFTGDDWVRVASPSAVLKPTSAYAISAWVRYSTTDSSGADVVSMGDNYALRLRDNGGVATFFKTAAGTVSVDTLGVDTSDGTWHHLVGQYTGSALQIYVDGVLKQEVPASGSMTYPLGQSFYLGRNGNGGTSHDFIGTIDQVRVYGRALTAGEIAALAAGR